MGEPWRSSEWVGVWGAGAGRSAAGGLGERGLGTGVASHLLGGGIVPRRTWPHWLYFATRRHYYVLLLMIIQRLCIKNNTRNPKLRAWFPRARSGTAPARRWITQNYCGRISGRAVGGANAGKSQAQQEPSRSLQPTFPFYVHVNEIQYYAMKMKTLKRNLQFSFANVVEC